MVVSVMMLLWHAALHIMTRKEDNGAFQEAENPGGSTKVGNLWQARQDKNETLSW